MVRPVTATVYLDNDGGATKKSGCTLRHRATAYGLYSHHSKTLCGRLAISYELMRCASA